MFVLCLAPSCRQMHALHANMMLQHRRSTHKAYPIILVHCPSLLQSISRASVATAGDGSLLLRHCAFHRVGQRRQRGIVVDQCGQLRCREIHDGHGGGCGQGAQMRHEIKRRRGHRPDGRRGGGGGLHRSDRHGGMCVRRTSAATRVKGQRRNGRMTEHTAQSEEGG